MIASWLGYSEPDATWLPVVSELDLLLLGLDPKQTRLVIQNRLGIVRPLRRVSYELFPTQGGGGFLL